MTAQFKEESVQKTHQYHWGWTVVFSIITIITVALRYALPIRDSDLFFHMLYGRYFLENRTLIADHTIFSWSPSTNDTIYCTWLPDILLYLLHKWVGFTGLFAFQYFCVFFFVISILLFANSLKLATHPFVWFVSLVGVLMAYVGVYLKPEIFSFLLMTLLVWNWFQIRIEENSNPFLCYLLPVIMLIWVNSHGAFIFGFIFLVCAALGELMNSRWSHGNILPVRMRKHLWMGVGLTAITPLINPYGWKYPYQLFFDLLPTTENITYNAKISAYISTFSQSIPYHNFALYGNIAVIIVAGLSFLLLRKKKVDWSILLPNIVFFYIYTMFFRTTFFLAPLISFSTVFMLFSLEKFYSFSNNFYFKKYFPIIATIFCIYLSSMALYKAFTYPEGDVVPGNFGIASPNPVDEAEYIKQNFPKKTICNSYNVGAYLLWKLWPENKVFFDARHFPYKRWSDEFFKFRTGDGVDAFLKKYPSDIWCIDHAEVIISSALRNSPDWNLAFYGRSGQVFVSKHIELPPNSQFKVSSKIDEIKSNVIAFRVFLFAISIYDWTTAEKMISTIKGQNFAPRKNITVTICTDLLAGMKAFAGKDYKKAIQHLTKFNSLVDGLGGYVVTSHLHLAQASLNLKNYSEALFHVQFAYDLLPDVFYTPYNLGLIEYLMEGQKNEGHRYVLEIPKWKRHFRLFLKRVASNQQFEKEIIFTTKVLAGEKMDLINEDRQMLIPQLENLR